MVTAILILFSLLALSVDYYILRRNVPNIKWLKVIYIAQAILLDLAIFAYLIISLIFRPTMGNGVTVTMLWVMLFFMMSFASKIAFGLFSLVELSLHRIFKKRYRAILYTGAALVVAVLSVMIYGTALGRNDLRVENVTIESEQLPDGFDGFTIAQFSDTHLGNFGESSRLIEKMVDKINALNPDIVIQSGDLLNIKSEELNDKYLAIFSALHPPVYAVLGNHDLGYYAHDKDFDPLHDIEKLKSKQAALGWRLLENEHVWLHRDGDSIVIGGVVYPDDGRFGVRNNSYGGSDLAKTFENVAGTTFSILISHTPSLFDSIPQVAKPNLTISGHVHSMQVKITIGNWRWSPAKWLFPMWSGLYTERGRHLYINDGIGYALYPMRIGVRPEITFYTLKKRKKQLPLQDIKN